MAGPETTAAKNRNAIAGIMAQHVPTTIRFQYPDNDGEMVMREVEPYEIKNGLLYGHCKDRDATRSFVLEKMVEICAGATFRPRYRQKIPC